MRKTLFMVMVIIVAGILLGAGGPPSWAGGTKTATNDGFGFNITYLKNEINALPKAELSKEEIEWIIRMREEEKLARDVYLTLYKKWKLQNFLNISKSEQMHMDAMKLLIEKYGLEDPVKSDEIGVFTLKEMKDLYEKLVSMGSKSLVDAIKVGMTIEDMDIYDLQITMKKTDNADVKLVYENLMKGSRNHMRAFYRTLQRYGGTYKPQYITKEEFEKIISTPMERGM